MYYAKHLFAYLLFGRLEHFLKAGQQQHGFGPGGRLQEHLVTARRALDEGCPDPLVWILQCVCFGQCGEVVGDMGQSRKFNITGGVRQGRVLSPRLFWGGLAIGDARTEGRGRKCGFQLDGGRS